MGKPFNGDYPITASKYYSSGAKHIAYDYGTPLGTPILSIGEGTVAYISDGVNNNPSGTNPGSGAPSNYIVVFTQYQGKDAYVYYQHLNKGLKVKKGDKVTNGQHIANSGNSGNSSGPHLHIATGKGHPPAASRYQYMDAAYEIFPPSLMYETGTTEEDMPEYYSVSRADDTNISPSDEWKDLKFDKESSDADNQHPDGLNAVILKGPKKFSAFYNITLTHDPINSSVFLRFVRVNADGTLSPYPYQEVIMTGSSSYAIMPMGSSIAEGAKLKIQIKNSVPAKITASACRLLYWKG